MQQPEEELIKTTCKYGSAGGRISITNTRVIINTVGMVSRKQQIIPRAMITSVDLDSKIFGSTLTIHRQGGDPVVVTTIPKAAGEKIAAILS